MVKSSILTSPFVWEYDTHLVFAQLSLCWICTLTALASCLVVAVPQAKMTIVMQQFSSVSKTICTCIRTQLL